MRKTKSRKVRRTRQSSIDDALGVAPEDIPANPNAAKDIVTDQAFDDPTSGPMMQTNEVSIAGGTLGTRFESVGRAIDELLRKIPKGSVPTTKAASALRMRIHAYRIEAERLQAVNQSLERSNARLRRTRTRYLIQSNRATELLQDVMKVLEGSGTPLGTGLLALTNRTLAAWDRDDMSADSSYLGDGIRGAMDADRLKSPEIHERGVRIFKLGDPILRESREGP